MSKYAWREGSRIGGVKADRAASEFERIRKKHGALKPALIVEEARPEKAPLHPAFEWDDRKAAESFRQQQAATMVRALVVVGEGEHERREYVLVSDLDSGGQYMPADVVVKRVDLFADAVGRLEAKSRELQASIKELEMLARQESPEPERMARIAMAAKALETASVAIAGLH